MIGKKLTVKNLAGLHLRPAGELCNLALKFESKITIKFRNKEFNAKSVLSVLSACVQQDDEIEVICIGSDEEKALEEIVRFIENEAHQVS